MTSFNLIYLLKILSPNTCTLGVSVSTYEFGANAIQSTAVDIHKTCDCTHTHTHTAVVTICNVARALGPFRNRNYDKPYFFTICI